MIHVRKGFFDDDGPRLVHPASSAFTPSTLAPPKKKKKRERERALLKDYKPHLLISGTCKFSYVFRDATQSPWKSPIFRSKDREREGENIGFGKIATKDSKYGRDVLFGGLNFIIEVVQSHTHCDAYEIF